ncbi:MFS transporter [Janthinobacterium rivuli]|uniref:MFS transporter n=1 Tax=Janthinobacterium sp. FT68W TaxID=2654255 RepID=UPI0012649B8D|nr:MFS transporter [Janthinobacterium sp. FT68W]KAB8044175.1 MFS transporter [Janthinobacterium sp. FT68W]
MNTSTRRYAGLRDFLLIWFGQMTSGIGSRLSSFALGIWVLRTTGSTTQFALIFVAMAVPALLIAPFAGALVDRWDRRRIMLCCDLVSASAQLVLAALLMHSQLAIWHIYLCVGATALANAFHGPAYASSIPLLVPHGQLSRVNGLVQTGGAIAQVAGPLLAGVLVSLISLPGVLLIDALSFVAAFIAMLLARIPRPPRSQDSAGQSLWREAATGWRYVRERNSLFGLLLVFGTCNFLFGIAAITITPLVLSMADPALLGVQMSIGGAGLLLGGVLMAASGGMKKRINGVLGFSLLAGLALAAHGLAPSFVLVTAAGFVFFLTLPVISASNDSLWQSKVPPGLQGRCFAIQRVLSEAAMPVGYCLAGPLAEHVFEPLLMPGGALAGSVGQLIGTGAGRGMGLMFIVLGLAMSLVAMLAYSIPALRRADELPDAWTQPPPAAEGDAQPA